MKSGSAQDAYQAGEMTILEYVDAMIQEDMMLEDSCRGCPILFQRCRDALVESLARLDAMARSENAPRPTMDTLDSLDTIESLRNGPSDATPAWCAVALSLSFGCWLWDGSYWGFLWRTRAFDLAWLIRAAWNTDPNDACRTTDAVARLIRELCVPGDQLNPAVAAATANIDAADQPTARDWTSALLNAVTCE